MTKKKKKDALKVDISDIMTISNKTGIIFIGGEKMTENEFDSLQQEALFLKGTRLWGILTNTLKDQAKKVMFEKAKDWNDMVNGKNILYCVGVQENIVEILTKNAKPISTKISLTEVH